jgi:protein involved in polysaccharide export with SLBB domain
MRSKAYFLLHLVLLLHLVAYGADDTPNATTASRPLSASFVNSMAVLNDEHQLGPGDQLSFRVIEDEDPPQTLTITASGEMEVPYIGRVHAAGKTCKAVAYALKPALEKEYYRQATVILGLDVIAPKGSVSKGKVYITGQVRTQGALEIPSDETFTLSKAILKAGGFQEYANKRKVRVTHKAKNGKTEVKTVDMVNVIEKGKTEGDITIEPDDVIFVPERLINF